MAEAGETIRLVELVCARLCHDLGGLIGTVGNALELAAEHSGAADEVLAFATAANKALAQRLRLMRTAWGPEFAVLPLTALVELTAPPLAARRIGLDSRALPLDCELSPSIGRVTLNLIVLAAECLPKGGTIVLLGRPDDLLLRIVGPGAAWPPGFAELMRDPAPGLAMLNGTRSLQMPLTVLFARRGTVRLSPVLGPAGGPAEGAAGGIEAVRIGGA